MRWPLSSLLFILGTLTGTGCAIDPAVLQRDIAAEVLSCPKTEIKLEVFAGETRIARGCGQEKWLTCEGIMANGSYEQCFPMQDLKKRALFESKCETPDDVTFVALDGLGHTVGVTACGKRGSYQYISTGSNFDWVMMTPFR
jgi:hypothetical protein